MQVRAEDLGHGRWPEVLRRAGMDDSYFGVRAGPCPLCRTGRDRFIWQEKNGGRWLCRHCTDAKYSGGMQLLIRWRDAMGDGPRSDTIQAFIEAANFVRDCFGGHHASAPAVAPVARREEQIDVAARRQRMERLWGETRAVEQGDPVHRYLTRRVPGLAMVPAQIRLHARLAYYDPPAVQGDKPVLVGHFAAMVVRGFNANGELVQLHKTYLTQEGQKAAVENPKKTDRGVGSNSFALRLMEPEGDTLGVCEGIETALAAHVLDGIAVWPCHAAGILANFVLPAGLRDRVKRVIIYADSDELKRGKRAGSFAAAQCADRLRREGIRTLIVRPAKVGCDMADLAAST